MRFVISNDATLWVYRLWPTEGQANHDHVIEFGWPLFDSRNPLISRDIIDLRPPPF